MDDDAGRSCRPHSNAARWRPGERLPPERSSGRRAGHRPRSQLRRALAVLEAEGPHPAPRGAGHLRHRASGRGSRRRRCASSPPPGPADVLELRLMIEPPIAAAAALRASDPAIAALRAHRRAMARARPTGRRGRTIDSRFHTAPRRASRNPLLTGVLETLNVIRRQRGMGRASPHLASDPREPGRLFASSMRRSSTPSRARDPQAAADGDARPSRTRCGMTMIGDDRRARPPSIPVWRNSMTDTIRDLLRPTRGGPPWASRAGPT